MYKNNKTAILYPIGLALVLWFGIYIGKQLGANTMLQTNANYYHSLDKLSLLLKYVSNDYVDSIPKSDLVEPTIPYILSKLDPHSTYIPARDLNAFRDPLEGNFDGIGVQFNMFNDTVLVLKVLKDSPSAKAGLKAGDRIVSVNDTSIASQNFSSEDIIRKLKGESGTDVNIGVYRKEYNKLLYFNIIRGKIPLYSIDVARMVDTKTGYIKISKFARTTHTEFVEAVAKLNNKGANKLIVDLRGNSGGYLDAAIKLADEFLEEGKLILFSEGNSRPKKEYFATSNGNCINTETLILIDSWSASASEVLAGALQDNDRATIVGRRSYGKGLIQEPFFFPDKSSIRLTTAKYYTPTGRSIQKSYSSNKNDYAWEIHNRFVNGEMDNENNIRFPDSLKYTTPAGKTVYGGGGIMPDVYIPLDTVGFTNYLQQISSKGIIYKFALLNTDKNRTTLNKFTSHNALKKHLVKSNLTGIFIKFAAQEGVPFNKQEFEASRKIIETHILAYTARILLNENAYYQTIHNIDNLLINAIKILKNTPK